MPLKDMATSTAAFVLIRTLGGTVGISVGQAIISSVCQPLRIPLLAFADRYIQELRRRISSIPGLTIDTSPAALTQIVRQIPHLPVSACCAALTEIS